MPSLQNPTLSDGYLISKWLQINNANYNMVFAPPLLIDQAISQSPQLLSDIGETILTNYSPVHAENYKNKIEKIYKVSFKEIFRANDFDMSSSSKIMNNLFSKISEEHMRKLSSEFGFKIVITKTEYINFKKINKINDYFIYLL